MAQNPCATTQGRYQGLVEKVQDFMENKDFSLSASVYTEVTDVEAEINGFITYDRQASLTLLLTLK